MSIGSSWANGSWTATCWVNDSWGITISGIAFNFTRPRVVFEADKDTVFESSKDIRFETDKTAVLEQNKKVKFESKKTVTLQ